MEDGRIDMSNDCNWSAFYLALCEHGPKILAGLDDAELEIVEAVAAGSDSFWSDGLQPTLSQGAADGDLRAGVVSTLELWRENVLAALSADFGMELDRATVRIDADSPLVETLVRAAASPA